MEQHSRVLYTAKTHTSGGREFGVSRSSDGVLDIKLGVPGTSRPGTNPEQLFAAGWSACFESAIGLIAKKKQLSVAGEVTIDAEVDLNLSSTTGYSLTVRMAIHIPGVDPDIAQSLVDDAHQICPYSKATRGNIAVAFSLI